MNFLAPSLYFRLTSQSRTRQNCDGTNPHISPCVFYVFWSACLTGEGAGTGNGGLRGDAR